MLDVVAPSQGSANGGGLLDATPALGTSWWMKSEDRFQPLTSLRKHDPLRERPEGLDVSVVRGPETTSSVNGASPGNCRAVSMEWMVTTSATPQVT